MQQYLLSTQGLKKEFALFVSDLLDEAVNPSAHAVSCTCVNEEKDLWAVHAYYDEKPALKAFENLLTDCEIDTTDLIVKKLENRNWVEESLKGLAPVTAGRFYVHGTHDRATRKPTAINIEIDAGTAFGTGHHGTTAGCLLALGDIARHRRPSNILDVGCGTGVLAMAAARRLKTPVIASDIDPVAVSVARQNAQINETKPFITTLTATGTDHPLIHARGPYELIFANILAGPLVALAPDIANLTAQRGNVVLSGLTCDQERWVLAAWRKKTGLILQKKYVINNWSTLVLAYPSRAHKKNVRHVDRTGQWAIAQWLGRRFAMP